MSADWLQRRAGEPVQPGDTVLFLSTGTGEAPHKRILDDPGREVRLAMTRYVTLARSATHAEVDFSARVITACPTPTRIDEQPASIGVAPEVTAKPSKTPSCDENGNVTAMLRGVSVGLRNTYVPAKSTV